MKTKTYWPFLIGIIIFSLTSCFEDVIEGDLEPDYTSSEYELLSQYLNLPEEIIDYKVEFADHMKRNFKPAFDANDDLATLGRVLFYDKALSVDRSVSCASCHIQEHGFADTKTFSTGQNKNKTPRNAIALGPVLDLEAYQGSFVEAGWQSAYAYFWDNRARSFQDQSRITIESELEMGMPMDDLVERLQHMDYYRVLFTKAYGYDEVNERRILDALEQFVNSMPATKTRFDEGLNQVPSAEMPFPNFSDLENKGKSLFNNHCGSCHGMDFTKPSILSANNGLGNYGDDLGMGNQLDDEFNRLIFKVPSLRNVSITAPYMHDGRFETLNEVVEHYNSGIVWNENLSPFLAQPDNPEKARKMNFTQEEKDALIAFLSTLTDEELLVAEQFSNPFK